MSVFLAQCATRGRRWSLIAPDGRAQSLPRLADVIAAFDKITALTQGQATLTYRVAPGDMAELALADLANARARLALAEQEVEQALKAAAATLSKTPLSQYEIARLLTIRQQHVSTLLRKDHVL